LRNFCGTFVAAAVLLPAGTAWGAAPYYTLDSIVNAGSFTPGPFAPNSILSIFGTDLSTAERKLMADDIRNGMLPTELNYTQVLVDGYQMPLLYVSPTQINVLISSKQSIGRAKIQVVRQSIYGPAILVDIVDGAPALFKSSADGYAIATNALNALLTSDSPAHAGDVAVLYLTGLGKTDPNPDLGEIPKTAALVQHQTDLTVTLGGKAVEASRILYAGLTPGCAGLYQINFVVPDQTGADPEIRVSLGGQTSAGGLKLPVR
jgi:uncharacterized protein (TIGR03437 family)